MVLGFTLSTSFFYARMISDVEVDRTPESSVVVAKKKINTTTPIQRRHFTVIQLPTELLPQGYYTSLDELFPMDQTLPRRTLKRVVYPHEVILRDRISDPRRGDGLESMMSKNQLAFSFNIDRLTTRSNVIYPTARVDILFTLKRPAERDSVTKLIAQNLKVLRVNEISDASEFDEYMRERKRSSRPDVLTVLARDLEQAQALAHASSVGKLNVLLRNTRDVQKLDSTGVTTGELSQRASERAKRDRRSQPERDSGFRRVSRPRPRARSRQPRETPTRQSKSVTTIEL